VDISTDVAQLQSQSRNNDYLNVKELINSISDPNLIPKLL